MKNNLVKWILVVFGTASISLSMFLTFSPIVFASCTITQSCGNSPQVSCSGEGSTCKTHGTYVSCVNSGVATTCHCGKPNCTDGPGGGGGFVPVSGNEN